MECIKIQAEMLKTLGSDDIMKRGKVLVGKMADGNICVLPDSYRVYIIPEEKFFLEYDKIPEFGNIDVLFRGDHVGAEKSGNAKRIGKVLAFELVAEGSKNAWVDEKLIKLFDKDCTFRIDRKDPGRRPVLVYELGICVGLVLPYNLRKED